MTESDATILEISGLSAAYRGRPVLHEVDLSVATGEIVTIVGPNGAGKSTLLKMIAGLLQPTAGRVVVAGRDLTGQPLRHRIRAGLGLFLQGGEVFPSLSVRANLELGGLTRSRASLEQRIGEVFDDFPDLAAMPERRAGLLSGGQRQQVALAAVLMAEPRVLLLDEPSAGLSPVRSRAVMQRLEELNRTRGITLVLVEQKLREALPMSDRVVVLRAGRIADEGRADSLLSEGRLADAFFA